MALNTKTSIVDYLKSVNKDSSYQARKKMAENQGISNYKGTADQNTKLLSMLSKPTENKGTETPKPVAETPKVEPPKQSQPQVQQTPNQPQVQPTTVAPIPSAPPQMNIDDIAKQFGFDYSRESAERQANAEAQAKRDAIADQKRAVESGVRSSSENLDHNYFLKGLQQAQNQTNSGLNAGIASDQNARLAMNKQANMADVFRDANAENMRLEDNLGRVDLEALAKADQLYNDRRQQGFDNALGYNDLLRRNFESDRNFNYGLNRDQVADQRYNNEWDYNVERDQIADDRYSNEWDYQLERDKIKDSQWAQEEARRKSSGGSSINLGMSEAQMRRLAEEEYKRMQEFVQNNQNDIQRGSGAMDMSQMDYILEQNRKTNPPTKPNMNFTGGMLDKYKYLYR